MRSIRQEITALGLDGSAVARTLPDWATDALGHPSGNIEVRLFIAAHFGLDINSDGVLVPRALPQAQFKTSVGTDPDAIAGARAVASAVARLVAHATSLPPEPVPDDPLTLRAAILGNHHPWIDLERLVEACWSRGIPVVYVPKLPVKGRKMDGMAVFTRGRPVILLTKKAAHADWLLFILAHELGHLGLKHLPAGEGESIIDEAVSNSQMSQDRLKADANAYGVKLLTGTSGYKLPTLLPAEELALRAMEIASQERISPGFLALNTVYNSPVNGKPPFALANAALKLLNEKTGQRNPQEICRSALRRHLDTDRLRDESVAFLHALGVG